MASARWVCSGGEGNGGRLLCNIGHKGETPLPAALSLFAGGLGVMGLLARRRMRKQTATLAA